MGTRLPLPKIAELPEVVVFHRMDPGDQRLLMQVPVSEDSAETYVVHMDLTPEQKPEEYDPRRDHAGWLRRLPNHQRLLDLLQIEMHVAFYPKHDGACRALKDPDEIPWVGRMMAEVKHASDGSIERYFNMRRARGKMMGQGESRLRQAIRGRSLGGARW